MLFPYIINIKVRGIFIFWYQVLKFYVYFTLPGAQQPRGATAQGYSINSPNSSLTTNVSVIKRFL